MTIRSYRFPVDFPEPERKILQQLCDMDYRSPELQLRYLVMSEAQRRGLVKKEGNGASLDNPPSPSHQNA